MSFDSLGLRAELLRALSAEGYENPTPVQSQAIPLILAGNDLLAGAQTGTGKTAGFTLPLLQLLQGSSAPNGGSHYQRRRRAVRALILTPTRELAAQVQESVKTYGKHLPGIRSSAIFGGVAQNPQIAAMRKGVDVLVATPGRLLDHIDQKNVDLSRVEILVLDEADRMLDMGFIRDVRKILGALPRKRQNLLFSATLSNDIRKLSSEFMKSPKQIQVEKRNTAPELVSQMIYPVDRDRKRALLSHLIKTGDWTQVLVFTRTKHGANRLAQQIKIDGISSVAIHGNKSQGARTKALKDFKRERVRVLVATDIAARGLDIDQLPHVVNYELPHVPEDYLHRIGRTGRAGNEGTAISLVCVDEHELLRGIERLLKRTLPSEVTQGFEPDLRAKPIPIQNGRGSTGGARRGKRPEGNSRPKRKIERSRNGNGIGRVAESRTQVKNGNGRPGAGSTPSPGRRPRKAKTGSRRPARPAARRRAG